VNVSGVTNFSSKNH